MMREFKVGDMIYSHYHQKHFVIVEWDGHHGEVMPINGIHPYHNVSLDMCELIDKSQKLKYKMFKPVAKKLLAEHKMNKVLDK